jgi:hypothetical protein
MGGMNTDPPAGLAGHDIRASNADHWPVGHDIDLAKTAFTFNGRTVPGSHLAELLGLTASDSLPSEEAPDRPPVGTH